MTPKERVIAALEHREPDRVPVGELWIDWEMTEQVLGHPTLYRSKWKEYVAEWNGRRDEIVESYKHDIVDLVRYLGLDFLAVPLVPARRTSYEPPEFVDQYTWRDADGRVWQYLPESGGDALVTQPIDLRIEDLRTPKIEESRLEAVEYVVRELGRTHFIMGSAPDGSFPWRETLGTMDALLVRMMDEPEFVERAIDCFTRESEGYISAMIEVGCDAASPSRDYCDNRGPFMGPAMWKQFCFPSLKRQADAAHAKGGFLVKHTDGYMWPILDGFVEAGVDGWQGIQPRIGMDFKLLKERYGDRLCLFGGVEIDTLVAGTPKDVVEEARKSIRHAAPGGGYVMTSGNSIAPGVKYENYMTMLRATRELGTYPIRA